MINFGSRLHALRISRGWTQEELADQLRLTKSVISAYETSLRYPSYDILIRICSIFGVTSDYMLGIQKQSTLDITGLSEKNEMLVRQIVDALREGAKAD